MENLEGAGNSRRLEGETASSTSESIGSLGEDETSPDLLKNTPSNIRRLAHEIHQCEARQKYLAQTRSPSDGVDIRWYFCKTHLADNELAASVPRTEIVGKGDYFRFGMRDSLAIEAAFLQREEELLSSWWKEYAECSEGPKGHISSKSKSKSKEIAFESEQSSELYTIEEERVGVPVKGGLYEVDLVRRQCFPVYWNGDNRRVLRGHWFARKGGLDWLPLREDVSEQLEFAYHSKIWHRRTFQPSGLFAARVELQGSASGLHALFTGEDDTWEAWINADAAGFTGVMSFGANGIMLRRGYAPSLSPKPTQDELRQQNEEEMDDYCSQVPVRHVVFMVHGIGQRLEKSNLVDDVGHFRHITASLAETHLTSYQRGKQRVLYIPCQWRKGLKLGGESAVEKITLDGVRGLRMTLSATVHDVLYYMSPIYCQDIIDSVSNQLNRLYSKFLRRNPGYDGKISLYGHSLGSVLSYDILCHQEHLSSPFPMEWMYKPHDVNEHAAPAMVSGSSESESSSNQQHNKCVENNECKFVTSPIDTDKPTLKDLEKQPHSTDLENNQPQVESLLDKPACVDMQATGMDDISEDQSIEIENVDGDSKNMSDGVFDDEKKVGLSKQLELEVDSLKERIAQLESQLACKVNEAEPSARTDLSLTERNVHDQVDEQKSYTPYIRYTKLEFKVDTFFAVGSPLGVFLALRNVRIGIGKGKDYWHEENITEEMPCCRQMVNIFHPFDPVAYRLEPLTCEEYINKRPVIIPYHKGGKRLHIGFQEFTEDLAARSQAIKNHLISVRVKVLTLCQSRDKDNMDEQSDNSQDEQRSYGVAMMQRLSGSEDGRVDHVLQDKTFRHQYLSALSSHTNYWRDCDTALFMLKHLYRDIPEEQPDFVEDSKENSSKNNVPSGGWVDQRESIEEELPLTFGDTALVKNFSSRAKKFMKLH
ncbi:phospholipase SGR2 [Impatiens glandulifera]|uniref:phospholipase SGR2 n=1 Tax=Impatiens glandulifera TaxID=253017 RepID=UPI001FB05D35|nr:phospholipase SGR2 [Impatiens glandulifera]XP_047325128.1 phospholipase SGR2 [Impatiens glandulifera]